MSEPAGRAWESRSAWDGVLAAGRLGALQGEAGVVVKPCDGLHMASVIGRQGDAADLAARFASHCGVEMPREGRIAVGSACSLLWSGPDHWLALSSDPAMPAALTAVLEPAAAVIDQSASRAVLCLEGRDVRRALAKGCPLDLHTRNFCEGDTALTVIEGIGVQLFWMPGGTALYLAVARSMSGGFWSWLLGAGAEFGLRVERPSAPRGASR